MTVNTPSIPQIRHEILNKVLQPQNIVVRNPVVNIKPLFINKNVSNNQIMQTFSRMNDSNNSHYIKQIVEQSQKQK